MARDRYKDEIEAARRRLRDGEATPEDLTWARQRFQVLLEWPDDLTRAQTEEIDWLAALIGQPA